MVGETTLQLRQVITRNQLKPLLLGACPSFATPYQALVEASDDNLPYVVLGAFASHLLDLHRQNRDDEFPPVLEMIERLHMEGDACVREAATIGLLEGIQNVRGDNGSDPELFGRYLLPESRRWWNELNAFWQGERRYVGEGLDKQLTDKDISEIRMEIQALNERLQKEREGTGE